MKEKGIKPEGLTDSAFKKLPAFMKMLQEMSFFQNTEGKITMTKMVISHRHQTNGYVTQMNSKPISKIYHVKSKK